jgi:hypothetical protein
MWQLHLHRVPTERGRREGSVARRRCRAHVRAPLQRARGVLGWQLPRAARRWWEEGPRRSRGAMPPRGRGRGGRWRMAHVRPAEERQRRVLGGQRERTARRRLEHAAPRAGRRRGRDRRHPALRRDSPHVRHPRGRDRHLLGTERPWRDRRSIQEGAGGDRSHRGRRAPRRRTDFCRRPAHLRPREDRRRHVLGGRSRGAARLRSRGKRAGHARMRPRGRRGGAHGHRDPGVPRREAARRGRIPHVRGDGGREAHLLGTIQERTARRTHRGATLCRSACGGDRGRHRGGRGGKDAHLRPSRVRAGAVLREQRAGGARLGDEGGSNGSPGLRFRPGRRRPSRLRPAAHVRAADDGEDRLLGEQRPG